MAFQGTFVRHEPGNYGGKLVFETQKGPFTMDNQLPRDALLPAPGTQVSFEGEKKGNYWKCKSITPMGGQHAPQNGGHQQAYTPQQQSTQQAYTPTQQAAAPAGNLPDTFLSNCLAHAIQANVVQGPSDLSLWAKGLREAYAAYHGTGQQQGGGDPGPQSPDDYYG